MTKKVYPVIHHLNFDLTIDEANNEPNCEMEEKVAQVVTKIEKTLAIVKEDEMKLNKNLYGCLENLNIQLVMSL